MFKFKGFRSILLAAASAMTIASVAHAADPVLPDIPEAPIISGFDWNGFYIGIGGGVGAVVHELGLDVEGVGELGSLNGIGGEGFFGEITLGYDFMFSDRFLVGAFADAHYGNIGPSLSAGGGLIDADLENTYGFDVGARLGYLLNPNALGYVLGGYSWQHFDLDGTLIGAPFEFEEERDGYVLGVGIETVLGGAWTLKTEYRYANYGNDTVATFDRIDLNVEPSTHTFHIGANYRFGADNGGGTFVTAPAYDWTGFYIGGAVGAGAVVYDLGLLGGFAEFDGIGGEGVFGELSVGYDHDFGNWVAGIQLDGRYSGISSELTIDPADLTFNADADYGFDVIARAGMKVNESTLAYVLGGYSWQHFDLYGEASGDEEDIFDWDSNGFTVGGGLEAAVSSNMTVNLEYRYSQYDGEDFDSDGLIEAEPSFQTVRIGAKWKFN